MELRCVYQRCGTFEDCKNAMIEAMADERFKSEFDQFIDLSEAQYVPSIRYISDAFRLTSLMKETLKGKIAVVTFSKPTFNILCSYLNA